MLNEKELEQISEIVKQTKDRNEEPDGCVIVLGAAVMILALFGAFCLICLFTE